MIRLRIRNRKSTCSETSYCCSVPQSSPSLCNPMDGSTPGSSVHRVLQARVLEWAAISLSGIRDQTCVFCIGWQILYY